METEGHTKLPSALSLAGPPDLGVHAVTTPRGTQRGGEPDVEQDSDHEMQGEDNSQCVWGGRG